MGSMRIMRKSGLGSIRCVLLRSVDVFVIGDGDGDYYDIPCMYECKDAMIQSNEQ